MVKTAVNNILIFISNMLLDVSILGAVFTISNISDANEILKFATSFTVFILAIIRVFYFVKNKNGFEKDKNK
jgi:hypothetical protein